MAFSAPDTDLVDQPSYDTKLTPQEEQQFQVWKQHYAPKDSGDDYDLRGAFKAGLTPNSETGHWPDTYKKPNHPTFSDESIYAKDVPEKAGHWHGETYIPASKSGFTAPDDEVVSQPETKPKTRLFDNPATGVGQPIIFSSPDTPSIDAQNLIDVKKAFAAVPETGDYLGESLPHFTKRKVSQFFEKPSLLGISPENVPSGKELTKDTGLPLAITEPASSIDKTVAGIAEFLTSPKGIAQTAALAVPGLDIAMVTKWTYDMIKGGYLNIKDAVDAYQKGDTQRLSDDIIGATASFVGAMGVGKSGQVKAKSYFDSLKTKTTPTTGEQNAIQIGKSTSLPLVKTPQDSGSVESRQIVQNRQEGVQAQEQGTAEAPSQQDIQPSVKPPEPAPAQPAEVGEVLQRLAKGMIPVRTAKSAADLSQTAAENGFEELPEDEKAKYSPTTKASQIRKVSNLIGDDIENARAIVRGEKPVPNGIKGQVLWNAMEKIAMEQSDVGMINELVKSPLAAKRSIAAQELGASAFNQNPHSPAEAVREITEAREQDFLKKTGQKPEVAKKRTIDTERNRMNGEIKRLSSKRQDWSEFIQSIACRN
jgi:hypothetical protein